MPLLKITNKKRFYCTLLLLLLSSIYCFGQQDTLYYPEKPIINQHDSLLFYLKKSSYKIDPNAAAIKLWELGDITARKGYLNDIFIKINLSTIIKFLSHEAVQKFSLDYLPMDLSGLSLAIRGVVYNLDGDSVKTDTFSLYPNEVNAANNFIKVPGLKVGSILDIKVVTDLHGELSQIVMLPTWYFDGDYATKFSAYYAKFPAFYQYRNIMTSTIPFKEVKTSAELSSGAATFVRGTIGKKENSQVIEVWERKNIPAFRKEVYMPAPEAYLNKVGIQFIKIMAGRWTFKRLIVNWDQVTKKFYKNIPEIKSIFRNNGFLEKSIEKITAGDSTDLQTAQSIYRYVRDTFTKTKEGYFARTNTKFQLKKLLESRNGSKVEINLLLAAMLQKAGLQSNLMMISTKPNPPLNPDFPNIHKIKTVICYLKIGNKQYFLDASDKNLPFDLLNPDYYNGYSRALSKEPFAVNITSDSVQNHTVIYAAIKPDSTNKILNLKLTAKLDQFSALAIRKAADGNKEKAEELLKATYNSSNFEIQKVTINGLKNPDIPLQIIYFATLPLNTNHSRFYLPLFFDKISEENPFPDLKRNYPIDLDSRKSYSYYLRFAYPENFVVPDIPKPIQLKLADGKADFKASVDNDTLQHVLTASANFHTTASMFPASDYDALRSLWATMLTLTNQNIILEKKNN